MLRRPSIAGHSSGASGGSAGGDNGGTGGTDGSGGACGGSGGGGLGGGELGGGGLCGGDLGGGGEGGGSGRGVEGGGGKGKGGDGSGGVCAGGGELGSEGNAGGGFTSSHFSWKTCVSAPESLTRLPFSVENTHGSDVLNLVTTLHCVSSMHFCSTVPICPVAMPITGPSQRMSLNVEKHFDAGWSGAGNCGAGGGRSGLGGSGGLSASLFSSICTLYTYAELNPVTVATLEENVGDDATFFTISQAEFVSIQQSTSTGYRVLIVWFLCNETSFSSMKCGISSTIAALSTVELPTAEAMYGTLATSNVTISLVTIGTPGVECWGDGRGRGCA